MKCLSCHKKLETSSKGSYHSDCAEKLFGVTWVPAIPFSYTDISSQAQKLVGAISISGVQAKLSVRLSKKERQMEVVGKGGTHILKPSPEHFSHLAENENFCMNLAGEISIETPPHGLLPLLDGRLVYIIKRFDRAGTDEKPVKHHVEDFVQLLEKEDKYEGSIEQIGRFLKQHSAIPFIDTQKLFIQVLFYFLIGNGDAHHKNFAMIHFPNKGYRLAPAYDIVSSRLVLPTEADEMALTINGRRNKITLKDFEALAHYLEIDSKTYQKHLENIRTLNNIIQRTLSHSFLPEERREKFLEIFKGRYQKIFGR